MSGSDASPLVGTHSRVGHMGLGALETLPLVVAAFPFGVVFGALAHSTGLSFGVAAGKLQDLRIDQAVVKDDVRFL